MQWVYVPKIRSKNSSGTVLHTFYPTFPPVQVGPPTYEKVVAANELLDYSQVEYLRGFRAHLPIIFEQAAGHIDGYPHSLETVLSDLGAASTNYLEASLNDNLVAYPTAFDNAIWNKNQCSVTATNITDPLGGTTADEITPDAGATEAYVFQQGLVPVTFSAGQVYTFSIYAKAASGTPSVNLRLTNQLAAPRGTVSMALTTSWQRFSVSGTVRESDIALNVYIGGISSFTEADGPIDLWGAQLVEGPLTPYIDPANAWKRINIGDSYNATMPSGKRVALHSEIELIGYALQTTIPSPDSGLW
jgi:hypothetical protein